MDCFPCAVAKRNLELLLAERGVPAEEIVERVSATQCMMCAEADRQAARHREASGS